MQQKLTKFKLSSYRSTQSWNLHSCPRRQRCFIHFSLFRLLFKVYISAFSLFALFPASYLYVCTISLLASFSFSFYYELKLSSILFSVCYGHFSDLRFSFVLSFLCVCVFSFFWAWGSEVSLFCCHFSALEQVSMLKEREKFHKLQKKLSMCWVKVYFKVKFAIKI